MFYACMLFSPPQSWPLDSCSTTGPGCLRKTSATSRAAVGTARAPCQLKFPLGEGPFPQQDLHGFHMGLCPEVQLSCHSKTASRELATHVPTSCACPFPLPDHLMRDVSLSRKDGQSETCQGISPLRFVWPPLGKQVHYWTLGALLGCDLWSQKCDF